MTRSILLITVDCLRPDHISGYGYRRKTTPNIDSLINRSTTFTHAFSNGPGTRYGFKSIHGGVHPLTIQGVGLPRHAGATLAETLQTEGYRTGGFADNPFVSTYFNYDRGFEEFVDYTDPGGNLSELNQFIRQRIGPSLPKGRLYDLLRSGYDATVKFVEGQGANVNSNDRQVVEHAIDWIGDAVSRDEPYFAWVHLMDAHHPYGYFPDHRTELGIDSDQTHVRMPSVEPGTEPPQPIVDAYDANIRNADWHVGELLAAMDDHVTVILTADHGEELGLHNEFHDESVYQSIARIPLIVSIPRTDTETREWPVSLVDIPPTVTQIAGAEQPECWEGKNVLTVSKDRDIYIGFENDDGIQLAIVRGQWKYVRSQDTLEGEPTDEQLFNIQSDPREQKDYFRSECSTVQSLREQLDEFCRKIQEHRYEAERDVWSSEQDLTTQVSTEGGVSEADMDAIDDRLEHLGYK
jgi:arylsulfatase A-like enzyme